MKIYINEIDYTSHLAPGLVINSTLTEELDSATIILNFMPYTNFEPFQKVRIEMDDGTKRYFLINTYVDTQITFETPILYTYTIRLISETKKLERVILPNLSIKKPIGGNTKRIIDYIEWIVMPYVKKQFKELYFAPNIEDVLEEFPLLATNCPEIQWATPNAKVVINDLLSSIPNSPYLVRVENNRLNLVSLSQKNNEVSKNGVVKIENYQQMSETANNLVFDAQNVVPNEASISINNGIRSESGADLTTENGMFIIPNARIDRIKSLKLTPLIIYTYADEDPNDVADRKEMKIEIDITKYVVEKSIYDTYKVSSNANLSINAKGYKRNAIYYKQGDNKIDGLFYKDSFLFSSLVSKTALGNIYDYESLKYIERMRETHPDIHVINIIPYNGGGLEDGDQPYQIHYELEFYSLGDFRLKTYKSDAKSFDTSLKSQQNQQYLDMLTLEQFQRQSINRLGNEVLSISAIYSNNTQVPKLGDWYGDNYILAQSEVAYRPDYILFSGLFSKNYLVTNQYYGTQSRRRYTQYVTTGEALVREEHQTINVTLSTEDDVDKIDELSQYFASYFNGTIRGKSHLDAFKLSTWERSGLISETFLQPYVYSGEKSTYVTAQCEDNVSVGKKIVIEGTHKVEEYVMYVDSNGEFRSYQIGLINNLDVYPLSLIDNATNTSDEDAYQKEYFKIFYELPEIPSTAKYNELFIGDRKEIFKDNGEIFKQTIQFNFESDSESLIVGNVIGRENSLTDSNIHDVKLVQSRVDYLDKDNPTINNTYYDCSIIVSIVVAGNGVRLRFRGSTADENVFWKTVRSWALVDEENNVIVGMNNGKRVGSSIKTSFYINAK